MNVLIVSIDSLRCDFLGAYDGSTEFDVATPNLDRFAERATVFDRHYAGSLPCMPARREWLCGVQEFLWRPWGPVEPFDRPLPRLARDVDTVTKLVTDHFHYFQHGSDGYYQDFHGFDFVRGHEDDAWRTTPITPDERLLRQIGYTPDGDDAAADPPETALFEELGLDDLPDDPTDLHSYRPRAQYARNVDSFEDETDFFTPKVFEMASEWLSDNADWDQWLLYVDNFDVHEPFHCPEPYASMYTDEDPRDSDLTVWPFYGHVDEGPSALTDRELTFVRSQFAGKVTMVDRWFGRLLDAMDREGLWDDTMVVVTADHGHFLGEHGWIGKPVVAPDYDVLARTPLLIWHPDSPRAGETTTALTSAVDLYATMADALGTPTPDGVHSRTLAPLLAGETDHHRDWAVYGWWGSSINVTDGQYTYLHPADDDVLAPCYSTMMLDRWGWMSPTELPDDPVAGEFLPYADVPVWQYTGPSMSHDEPLLFDVEADPTQENDLAGEGRDAEIRMRRTLIDALDHLEAPDAQYERFGLASAD